MPRNAAVSVGCLWGRSGRRTCGISVGYAGDLRRFTELVIHRRARSFTRLAALFAESGLIRGPAVLRSWLDRQAVQAKEVRARAEALRADA